MAARLTVLNVSYPLAVVGPDAVGGAEQILTRIDEAVVERGHRSIVVAPQGSCIKGELIPIPLTRAPLDESAHASAIAATRSAIAAAFSQYVVDLVHLHALRFEAYLPPPGPPVLATLHLPPATYSSTAFHVDRPETFVNCVSDSQQAALPPTSMHVLPPIPNGVPLDAAPVGQPGGKYALALGRVCPEKGFHLAARAARTAGIPLILGGKVFGYQTHQDYFRESLTPLLDPDWFRFVGPLRKKQKQVLLRNARCLLITSQIAETSSLVAMEAAAVGTPVVALRAGAVSEVVEHGRTGFVVDSIEEMSDAIARIDRIDRSECRAVAQKRFSAEAMAERYLRCYAELVVGAASRRTLHYETHARS